MAALKKKILRTGLETLYFSGAHRVLRPFVSGVGVILTLHHVRPARPDGFQPNRHLEVTPAFLEHVVRQVNASGGEFVSLDEMHRRVSEGDFRRRFFCLTFDDGYRDVLQHAYPLLRKHQVPFAIYVATSFPDRLGELWWLGLEAVIARNARIALTMRGREQGFQCATVDDKRILFDLLLGYLRSLKTEEDLRGAVSDLCARYHVDLGAFCRDLCMDWSELAGLAADPLVTIGAHTVNHVILTKVGDKAVRSELDMSRAVIEAGLGRRPRHFAYPVGDPAAAGPREFRIAADLGFKTAVTTRPGVLFAEHRDHLTALPRISLNGEYQQMRYVSVLTSGAASAMWNGFRRVSAA